MSDDADELIPTRQSLLGRLKNWDDQESWRDFFDSYWRVIYGAAVRCGLTDAEAQEVVQETVIAVAKKMGDFRYDPAVDSFKGWLLYLTRKRIAGQFRQRERQQGGPLAGQALGSPDDLQSMADPAPSELEAVWDQEWEKHLLTAALTKVKQQVNPKQFQIFTFYVLKQWPVREVVKTLGVSVAQVYLAKHRVSRLMKKELEHLKRLRSL